MREIRLYGHLATEFGNTFFLDVKSPGEAIAALCANFAKFRSHLAKHSAPGYRVLVGRRAIDCNELNTCSKDDVIRFVPVIAGSKGGVGQIILGAVLIIAGTLLTPFAAPLGGAMIKMGWGMVASGVITLLSSPPKSSGPKERAENQPSYAFNGAVNTTAQGNPVPICFGEMIIGSQVVSAGISTDQIPVGQSSGAGGGGDGGSQWGSGGVGGLISSIGGQFYDYEKEVPYYVGA